MKWRGLAMLVLLFGLSGGSVLASGFYLKSIGNVDTGGRQIDHWWYSGNQPTLKGEASPGADVIVEIDGTVLQVSADSAGEWVFTPTTVLSGGDHMVSIKGEGTEINFTLTIGSENVDWDAVGTGGGETLPTVGTIWPTLVMMAGAAVMMIGGKMATSVKKN